MKIFAQILRNILLCSRFSTAEENDESTEHVEDNKGFQEPLDHPLRIIAGIADTTHKYPFTISFGGPRKKPKIFRKFYGICTGSLISDQWVLTVAHCSQSKSETSLVRYGDMAVPPNDPSATYSNIIKFIKHHNYYKSHTHSKNDIGLILIEKVNYNHYGRVSVVDYKTLIGLPVVYVGFGRIAHAESSLLKQLKNRQFGEAAVNKCSRSVLGRSALCSARKCSNKAQQAFSGDSGGPLLQAGRIVGVCHGGLLEFNDVFRKTVGYTAVSPFQDWISITMSRYTP